MVSKTASKAFFFEKKKQKTFAPTLLMQVRLFLNTCFASAARASWLLVFQLEHFPKRGLGHRLACVLESRSGVRVARYCLTNARRTAVMARLAKRPEGLAS